MQSLTSYARHLRVYHNAFGINIVLRDNMYLHLNVVQYGTLIAMDEWMLFQRIQKNC